MHFIFVFALRLLLAFLTAKLLLRWFGWDGFWPLVGFTLLFLGNCYLFDVLDLWEEKAWRRPPWIRRRKTPPGSEEHSSSATSSPPLNGPELH